MFRVRIVLPVVLVATLCALPATSQGVSGCTCPKEGHWNVQNHEGWMDCTGPINFKRKLKPVKDKGRIFIEEEDCSSLFGEASKEQDEDVLMNRIDDCSYEGTINDEEEGITMEIEITWTIESEQHIKGEMSAEPSLQGMTCEYFRPFEITWEGPLGKDEVSGREKKR